MFGRKKGEEETIRDNWRFKHRFRPDEGDLECEEAIMKDKNEYGSVRPSLMRFLRTKYGIEVANRALYRVNKRLAKGYFKNKK